jgi:uncharacterized membrane protein
MRTTASVGGHPVHMMVVHFPMAFLMGSVGFDVAAAFGFAVPLVVPGYLLLAGLATGVLAAVPGAVDFVTTVRLGGGRQANKAVRHAALSMASLGVFAFAWFQRREVAAAPSMNVLLMELLGVALLMISGLLGGSLVLEDRVGVAEHGASSDRGKDRSVALDHS